MASGNLKRRASIRVCAPTHLAESLAQRVFTDQELGPEHGRYSTMPVVSPFFEERERKVTDSSTSAGHTVKANPIARINHAYSASPSGIEVDGYDLQEELEQEWRKKEHVRHTERSMSRRGKDKVKIEITNFYNLLRRALMPETLKDDTAFRHFLDRTKNLGRLLEQRSDVLSPQGTAEIIFKRKQGIAGADGHTQTRFLMLSSNFLSYCPGARHYLNHFAEMQTAYEAHLRLVESALEIAVNSQPLPRAQAEAFFGIPNYWFSPGKAQLGINKRSIREATRRIAALYQLAISQTPEASINGSKLPVLDEYLGRRVLGFKDALDALNEPVKDSMRCGNNGKKPHSFVNRLTPQNYTDHVAVGSCSYRSDGDSKVRFEASLSPIATLRIRL